MAIESSPISAQSPATVSSGQQTHRNPGGASRSYLPQRSIMPISDLRNKSLRVFSTDYLFPTLQARRHALKTQATLADCRHCRRCAGRSCVTTSRALASWATTYGTIGGVYLLQLVVDAGATRTRPRFFRRLPAREISGPAP